MICENCGKQIKYGYFWEGYSVRYICTECLLSYKEGNVNKYDRNQIMRLHSEGKRNDQIAEVMGTNPLTIAYIIRREKKREIHRRSETEKKD